MTNFAISTILLKEFTGKRNTKVIPLNPVKYGFGYIVKVIWPVFFRLYQLFVRFSTLYELADWMQFIFKTCSYYFTKKMLKRTFVKSWNDTSRVIDVLIIFRYFGNHYQSGKYDEAVNYKTNLCYF